MGKLVIDLGHGGHDPGAIGPNKTHEADVVLAIGKELNDLKVMNLKLNLQGYLMFIYH